MGMGGGGGMGSAMPLGGGDETPDVPPSGRYPGPGGAGALGPR
jgi:hypothetical protein